MHIEDLKVNDWIIILSRKLPPIQVTEGMQVAIFQELPTGQPYQIKAISIPFVAMEDFNGIVSTLHLTSFEFTKATPSYVKYLKGKVNG